MKYIATWLMLSAGSALFGICTKDPDYIAIIYGMACGVITCYINKRFLE